MNDLKYTLGPWKADGDMVRAVLYDEVVASTNPGCGCCSGPLTEQVKANAHLIAAAPDLLETTKSAITNLGKFGHDSEEWSDALERLNKAIAKAEGR